MSEQIDLCPCPCIKGNCCCSWLYHIHCSCMHSSYFITPALSYVISHGFIIFHCCSFIICCCSWIHHISLFWIYHMLLLMHLSHFNAHAFIIFHCSGFMICYCSWPNHCSYNSRLFSLHGFLPHHHYR